MMRKLKLLFIAIIAVFTLQETEVVNAQVYNGYLEYEIIEDDEIAIVGITGQRDEEGDLIITPAIKNIVIPETIDGKTVTTIKYEAFSYKYGPESVQIPKTVSVIEDGALNSCYSCEKFIVSEDNAFYCSDETGMVYNKAMTELIAFPAAVQGEIVIPDSVKIIRPFVFEYCKITKVKLPANLKIEYNENDEDKEDYLLSSIFYGCWELTEYDVSNDSELFSVEDGILYDKTKEKVIACPQMKEGVINIPESVKTVGYCAFAGVSAEINLPEGLTTLEPYAFAYSHVKNISIPASVTSIGEVPFYVCDELITLTVDSENKNYCAVDNILYTKDMKTLIQCPGGISGIIKVPDGVEEILPAAFKYNRRLLEVYLPKGIVSIGRLAFDDCSSLCRIVVSEGLKKIEWGVFSSDNLRDIILPQSIEEVYGLDSFGSNATLYVVGNSFMHKWVQDNWDNYRIHGLCSEHSYGEWTVSREPSCVAGQKVRMCTRCFMFKETEAIAANGEHNYINSIVQEATCVDEGIIEKKCSFCGKTSKTTIPASGEHSYIDLEILTEATCGVQGSKEMECEVCGEQKTEIIPATGNHTYGEWSIIQQPTSDKKGIKTRKCTVCGKEQTEEIAATENSGESKPDNGGNGTTSEKPSANSPESTDNTKPDNPSTTPVPAVDYQEGTDFSNGKDTYKVVSLDGNKGTVVYTGSTEIGSKTISIPKSVTIDGKTFNVTEIADNAFKNNTKVTNITVSANITKIGKDSFSGCKNLKKITIKSTTLKKVGKNAFKGIHKKAVIKVPKKQLAKYKKLLKGKGQPKTVKIK